MPSQRQISVRRAPKYVPFLVAGGLLGVIVAAVTSYAVPAPKDYTQESVFGYFLVLFAAAGVLVGGLLALVLDRVSLRRAQRATVEEIEEPEDAAEGASAAEAAEGASAAEAGAVAHDGGPSPSSADSPQPHESRDASEDGREAGPTPAP